MFSSLRQHARALGLVASITVATVTTAALAVTGGTQISLHQFVMQQPNDAREGSLAGARFNIVGFMGHPCYVITNDEATVCKDLYGMTVSLKTLLDDGTVLAFARTQNLLPAGSVASASSSSSASSVPTSGVAAPTSGTSSSISSDPYAIPVFDYNSFHARSQQLWNICASFYVHPEANACYHRNIRLLRMQDVVIDWTNVH